MTCHSKIKFLLWVELSASVCSKHWLLLFKAIFFVLSYGSLNSHQSTSFLGCGGGGLFAKLCLTLVTPRTIAHQAPLSVGFSRQGY